MSADWTDDASGRRADQLLAARADTMSAGQLLSLERRHQDNATDRALLAACSRHVLQLQPDELDVAFDGLLTSLEFRQQQLPEPDMDDQRFRGWCTVVSDSCGLLHLANRHLIYRTGSTVDDRCSHRLEALLIAGINELDRRFGRRVASGSDWMLVAAEPDAVIRRRLANAINYLARDAFSLESSNALHRLADVLGTTHVDIAVQVPTFAMIPFTDSRALLFQRIRSDVQNVETYLSSLGSPSLEASEAELDIRAASTRALASLAGTAPDLTPFEREEQKPTREARFIGRVEIARKHHEAGRLQQAQASMPPVRSIKKLQLVELHSYLLAASVTADRDRMDAILRASFERLHHLAPRELGQVNFLARAIQFYELLADHQVLENANTAFERFVSIEPNGTRRSPAPWVLFCIDQCRVTPGLVAPLSRVLSNDGVEFYNLQDDRFTNRLVKPWTLSPRLSAGSISVEECDLPADEFHNDWDIDLEGGEVITGGVNYFQGLYERVGRVLKVYDVDWDMPAARTYSGLWLRQLDRSVKVLDGVRRVSGGTPTTDLFRDGAVPLSPVVGSSHLCDCAPRVAAARHDQLEL